MGALQRGDERHELRPSTTVGRAPQSTLRLSDPAASAAHALLAWTGEVWTVQDLASRNGTLLDGVRVEPGVRVCVGAGAALRFGGEPWVLVDASAPPLRAVAEGRVVTSHTGSLLLPDAEAPVAAVLRAAGGWVLDIDGEQRAVEDGDVVEVAGHAWRLELPLALPGTVQARLQLQEIGLQLRVSADEEHVELDVLSPAGPLPVPGRAHHYLLLTLARARLRDRAAGCGPTEEGWEDVELLARRLGVTGNAFHVQLCRARAQFGELGVLDAGALIERRPGGRVRLGVGRVEIQRLQ
jgi:hypothetical protein